MKDCVELLLNWYQENQRSLPWREDKDPYHVWVSEIMLQQTRIEAVIEYYYRFMDKVPTIEALSMIPEDELLKLWEGLGYYTRARNLKKAATMIINDYNGVFPSDYSTILSLPGIGEYTAGAISSICFNLKEVAIDGNVMRVYARVNNLDIDVSDIKVKKVIGIAIKNLLPSCSGDFNQAIMELGETICIPVGTPKCNTCPLKQKCLAHQFGRESLIPQKVLKKDKTIEEYTVLLIRYHNLYALRKRREGLLKNMWEFPNVKGLLTDEEISSIIPNSKNIQLGISNTHIFTHKKWIMNSYYLETTEKRHEYDWFPLEEFETKLAIPTAFQPFLSFLIQKK